MFLPIYGHKPNPPALEKAFMDPKWFAWKF